MSGLDETPQSAMTPRVISAAFCDVPIHHACAAAHRWGSAQMGQCTETVADRRASAGEGVSTMVIAAAQAAGLHDTIMGLPDNYWTIIGNDSDAAGVLAQHAEHERDSHSCSGFDEQLPRIHVLSATEGKLLAMARKRYLDLRTAHRAQCVQPQWRCKHASRPLGAVPDFRAAHRALARWSVRGRQRAVAAGLTVPREFEFDRGRSSARMGRHVCTSKHHDKYLQVHEVRKTSWLRPRGKLQLCELTLIVYIRGRVT